MKRFFMLIAKKGMFAAACLLSCLAVLTGCGNNSQAAVNDRPNHNWGAKAPDANDKERQAMNDTKKIIITVNGRTLSATLADNSSAEALADMLADGPVSISMEDYGNMEKVGDIGKRLPTNDRPTNTKAGDLILYTGSKFVIYYAPNSWNFTRLGKIDNVSAEELKEFLGKGDVEVELSLPR